MKAGNSKFGELGLVDILVAAMILGHLDGSMDFSQNRDPDLFVVDS